MSSGNPVYFTFTDALNTEKTLNWWNCYNVDDTYAGSGRLAWIPTVAAVDYTRYKGKRYSAAGVRVPNFGAMVDLMKIVPYGRVDGMISSSFPTNAEMYGFLMRSVGIEESLIEKGLKEKYGAQGDATYRASRVVRDQVASIKDKFGKFLADYGYDAAQQVYSQANGDSQRLLQLMQARRSGQSSGQSSSGGQSSSQSSSGGGGRQGWGTRPFRDRLSGPNANAPQPMNPLAFIVLPIAIAIIVKTAFNEPLSLEVE